MFHRTIADEPRPIHAHTRRFAGFRHAPPPAADASCGSSSAQMAPSPPTQAMIRPAYRRACCTCAGCGGAGSPPVHEAGIIAPRIAGRKDARRTAVWIDNTELIARGLLHCIGKQDRHGTRADGLAYLVEWDVGPAMGVLRQQHARGVARRPV